MEAHCRLPGAPNSQAGPAHGSQGLYLFSEAPHPRSSKQFSGLFRVNDVASWVTWAGKQKLGHITELDCKEQFNKIKPSWIDEHLKEGIAFIAKLRRWRMSEVTWSVHHTAPALDRPGLGTNKSFRYILHQVLSEYVRFELQRNNKCWLLGKLWSRDLCIPMGREFFSTDC